jgi:hypothetical protein
MPVAENHGAETVSRIPFVLAAAALAFLLMAASSAFLAVAAELTFDLKVEHGRVADTMRLIRVKQGDIVKLRWTTDQPLVLHLHGYDIERRVEPGAAAEFAFTAYATGRFPIHVHAHGERRGHAHEEAPLVNVEVYPR